MILRDKDDNSSQEKETSESEENVKIENHQQVKVELSIDIYKDKVLCDVVPKETCHILLRRPLQIAKNSMLNGRTNKTTFTQKNIFHGGELIGQFGVDKTLEFFKGKFFWPPMRKDVQRHYHRCISRLKTNSKAMSHELYALSPFASAPWEDIISIGFILELPRTTKGFDSIFMVVDRLFFREVIRLHGLSPSIVLDRDPKFEDHFLRILLEKLGTKLKFSISYHRQTNGQNEVKNIALSTMSRVIMRDNHNSRDEYLSHIEFEYNRVVHKTTNISPFEAVYGFNPLSLLDLLPLPNPQEFVPKEGVTKNA